MSYCNKLFKIARNKYAVSTSPAEREHHIRVGGENHFLFGRACSRSFDDIRVGIIRRRQSRRNVLIDSGGVSEVRGDRCRRYHGVGVGHILKPIWSYAERVSRAGLISDAAHVPLLTYA